MQVRHPLLSGEAVKYDSVRQRAFVLCRSTAALVVVGVRMPTNPVVLGFLSSTTPQTLRPPVRFTRALQAYS